MRRPAGAALTLLLALAGCRAEAARETLLVFAAASLADALVELGDAFETATGAEVRFSFAGSNTLARQVALGAPADLLLVAHPEALGELEAAGRVTPGTAVPLLGNRLVVIGAPGATELGGPRDLMDHARVGIPDPQAAPAGRYAREWLEGEGVWHELAPRVVPTRDVRAAVAAVAGGHLPAAVVYASDVGAGGATVIYRVPPDRSPAILYLLAPVVGPQHPRRADFVRHLRTPAARAVFERHGFVAPGGHGAVGTG
jgi:molybdate transport system substrate-binding protein